MHPDFDNKSMTISFSAEFLKHTLERLVKEILNEKYAPDTCRVLNISKFSLTANFEQHKTDGAKAEIVVEWASFEKNPQQVSKILELEKKLDTVSLADFR